MNCRKKRQSFDCLLYKTQKVLSRFFSGMRDVDIYNFFTHNDLIYKISISDRILIQKSLTCIGKFSIL